MKKIILFFILLASVFAFTSCFIFDKTTDFSNMREYTADEVLSVAAEKYSVSEWLFTDGYLRGEVAKNANLLEISLFFDNFSVDFINGDNIDAAMTAFAGKNGGHGIQGQYRYFICYVAIAKCSDGSLKYIYYNTNIDKNAEIYDTIGASDYNLEVSPLDITESTFDVDPGWGAMLRYLSSLKAINPGDFIYSRENLTYYREESGGGSSEIEFYLEDGRVVFDIYYDKYQYDGEEKRLVYSSSDRYGVIYHFDGADFTAYFDVNTIIEPSTDESSVMLLIGEIEARPIEGDVIYSMISYRAEYPTLSDGKNVVNEISDTKIDALSIKMSYGMTKSNEIDYSDIAKFELTDYYILYIK